MTKKKHWHDKNGWEEIHTDENFRTIFTNATIIRATTSYDAPSGYGMDGDVYWELSDGSWVAMGITMSGGCPTCGYDIEKRYWYRPPQSTEE